MKTETSHLKREKVAEILLSSRVQKRLSQTQLAELAGCTQNTIARIENCRFSPNADQLYVLCEVLGIDLKLNDDSI